MHVFETVIVLLLIGAALAALARRIGAPYPALLALAGAAIALMPGVAPVTLDPELALALFVAPVLLDAAFDASPRDLRHNWRPVAGLALVTVAVTVAAVAVTARWLVPELPWAAAVALGAIVAPPDAAAATAVLRPLRPPHRLLVILEGESLFNDASALLIYRLAVAAAAGAISGWSVVPTLLLVTVGSVVLGLVLARVTIRLTSRIEDVPTAVIVQFVGTFGVWIAAERLYLSGILTMVVYAMSVARTAPDVIPARIRIPSYAVWEVAVFLLNALAFILVGLQLKPIVRELERAALVEYIGIALVVCAAVILVRIAWVLGTHLVRGPRTPVARRHAIVMAWAGMRGTVTLAAALALPAGFPHRDLILFTAFSVVLGTLVAQGLTLKPIMAWLGLEHDDSVEREVRLARVEALRAGAAALVDAAGETDSTDLLRRKYRVRLERAESRLAGTGSAGRPENGARAYATAARAAMAAERRRLSELRADGTIGDDAFHRIEEELDRAELGAEAMEPED